MWASHTKKNGSDNSFLCQYLYILISGPDLYIKQEKTKTTNQYKCKCPVILAELSNLIEFFEILSILVGWTIQHAKDDDSIVNISSVNSFDRNYTWEIDLKQVFNFQTACSVSAKSMPNRF